MVSNKSQNPRYFYHCFPQWIGSSEQIIQPSYDTGLQILSGMFKWGLLLTPEEIVFSGESFQDEENGEPIKIFQKRLCFTELSEEELPYHAQVFGPIALEFDQYTLRRMGGIPVIYIPQTLSDEPERDRLALVGQTFVYRLFEIYQLISDLADIQENIKGLPSNETLVKLGHTKEDSHRTYPAEMLRNFLEGLTHKRQPLEQLASAIGTLSCFFYPTDASTSAIETDDGRLAYYREREWRVVSGFYFGGIALDEELSVKAKAEIVAIIDNSFSPYEDNCISGDSFIHDCTLIRKFGDDSIMNSVRRILIPEELKPTVEEIAHEYDYSGTVVGYSKIK
jgi:Putative abortive phage resistance protein AbiGi, antitoxin